MINIIFLFIEKSLKATNNKTKEKGNVRTRIGKKPPIGENSSEGDLGTKYKVKK